MSQSKKPSQSQKQKQNQRQEEKQSKKQTRSLGQVAIPTEDAYAIVESVYPLNMQEINFLHEYNKDLDVERALKATGLKKGALNPHKEQGQALLLEMQQISKDWQAAIRMNTQAAAAKHMELMEKFEKDYDSADIKNQNKSGLSGTLARMSDANLKATGHYASEDKGGGTKVEINIDLGGGDKDKAKEPDIKITSGDE